MYIITSTPSSKTIKRRRYFYNINRRTMLEQLILRDGLSCNTCGKSFKNKKDRDLTIDHKIPISLGGRPTALSNLQILCLDCHRQKDVETRFVFESI